MLLAVLPCTIGGSGRNQGDGLGVWPEREALQNLEFAKRFVYNSTIPFSFQGEDVKCATLKSNLYQKTRHRNHPP